MGRNFVRDFVAAKPADERALVTLDAEGARREWTFADVLAAAGSAAGAFAERGVGRGDVVLTLVGNGIDYAATMLGCLHLGAVMLPCSEQLRTKDIALRLALAGPKLIVAHERNAETVADAEPACPVLTVPDAALLEGHDPPPYADLADEDPAFVLFTSGTSGRPKLVTHGQRYVWGQELQSRNWLGAESGELVWSTAAPGWSKSTRNAFLAAWWCGASALLQDRRFDPDERLATIRTEQVRTLCMAPTEYRLIAAHGPIENVPLLRRIVTAGEPLGAPAFDTWEQQTGLRIADGYGQTETGHISGVRPGETAPPGSMGRPLPGVRAEIVDGELCVDPSTVPTFFLGYDGNPAPDALWHTGDRARQDEDGWLFFEARADDVILSAGYRIGPAEVESTLLGHPAVRETAVIGVPDETRGEIVAAYVVLRHPETASEELKKALQEHVKRETAPYKYPRRVEFVADLPKTTSGKIARAELRQRVRGE